MIKGLLLFLVVMTLGGCTASMKNWVQEQGGCLKGAPEARAQQIATQFTGAGLNPNKVHVLNSEEAGAYSWASGDVYVSAGLLEVTSDEELAAAIAHEVGHLVQEYHVLRPRGLAGTTLNPSLDVESQADLTALVLLRQNHLSVESLIRVLEKVEEQNPSLRPAIAKRIAIIRAAE